jgi:hypothetical protein
VSSLLAIWLLSETAIFRNTSFGPGSPDSVRVYPHKVGLASRICNGNFGEVWQETQRHVELMWLLKMLRPDHQTIANFRRDHINSLREVCRAFTLWCKQLDLFGGELVAIDGSQFRAVNAKRRNFTKATLEKVIAQIDARVAGYLKELEAADDQDEAGTPQQSPPSTSGRCLINPASMHGRYDS